MNSIFCLFIPAFVSCFKFDRTRFKEEILSQILRVRIPGTNGHQKFIVNQLLDLKWQVEQDVFLTKTPFHKRLKFTNVIGTLNPLAPNRLVLACHYDSKYFVPTGQKVFVGATDSAVPCSILIYLAQQLTPVLNLHYNVTLQLLFFDGEEAFLDWSEEDSLYGSRHLADVFSKNHLKKHPHLTCLASIKLFILLDLLGYKDPTIASFYQKTEPEFEELCRLERSLYPHSKTRIFLSPKYDGVNYKMHEVGDDHKPFNEKGVRIIHLIPLPFPEPWHTFEDDESIIDMESVEKITSVLYEFIEQYFKKT
ncbi:Glutaminyl-peptide cyclotransferase [Thelohanellus kitauei]|uniref:glutaminyl-peptide cyclotransferase n=1 Tax=Thelohanellus kitauei TaxID=669202 RepID=A0A0C2MWY0_THEKT|nr:Glutaminyl-peptide cyclotransferase [Thelohanellus kitauei]